MTESEITLDEVLAAIGRPELPVPAGYRSALEWADCWRLGDTAAHNILRRLHRKGLLLCQHRYTEAMDGRSFRQPIYALRLGELAE